jgi:hypothetical protein
LFSELTPSTKFTSRKPAHQLPPNPAAQGSIVTVFASGGGGLNLLDGEITSTLPTADGLQAELTIAHGRSPKDAIVRLAREIHPDLVVMGAHGHRGLKDLIFGNTINAVRHEIDAPVLVVTHQPSRG